jgi:hypothetical protein
MTLHSLGSTRSCRVAALAFVLAGQLAASLHPGVVARADAAPPGPTAQSWLAEIDSTSRSRPPLVDSNTLWLSKDRPPRRNTWLLWATSAVAVGAVVAVFASRNEIDRAPQRPDLPDFPDAP